MAKAYTIIKVNKVAKDTILEATVSCDDCPKNGIVKAWANAPFADKIVAGAVLNLDTEERDSKGYKSRWIKTCDGVPEREERSKGGQKSYAPNYAAEQVAAALINGAMERAVHLCGPGANAATVRIAFKDLLSEMRNELAATTKAVKSSG